MSQDGKKVYNFPTSKLRWRSRSIESETEREKKGGKFEINILGKKSDKFQSEHKIVNQFNCECIFIDRISKKKKERKMFEFKKKISDVSPFSL